MEIRFRHVSWPRATTFGHFNQESNSSSVVAIISKGMLRDAAAAHADLDRRCNVSVSTSFVCLSPFQLDAMGWAGRCHTHTKYVQYSIPNNAIFITSVSSCRTAATARRTPVVFFCSVSFRRARINEKCQQYRSPTRVQFGVNLSPSVLRTLRFVGFKVINRVR